MYPQIACLWGRKVTLVAFVWLFSTVRFQMYPQLPAWDDGNSHWLHLLGFSPLCVFKCLHKEFVSEQAKSHWLHLFDFSPLCVFKCALKASAREDAKSHWLQLCIVNCARHCELCAAKQENNNNNKTIATNNNNNKTRYSTKTTFVKNCVRHCTLWKRLCHNWESSQVGQVGRSGR